MKEIKIDKLYWCEFLNDFGHAVDKVVKVRKKCGGLEIFIYVRIKINV